MPHPSWRNTAWLARNPWFEAEAGAWLRGAVAAMVSP
jgi:uracil-DNA glycosylase